MTEVATTSEYNPFEEEREDSIEPEALIEPQALIEPMEKNIEEKEKDSHATIPVMQIFFGEMDLQVVPQTTELIVEKKKVNGSTYVSWSFQVPTPEGNKTVTFPAHYFWRLHRTRQSDLTKIPTMFIIELCKIAHEELEKLVPEVMYQVKSYHEARNKEYPNFLIFTLDPSDIALFEEDRVIYRASYESMAHKFHETYAQFWARHVFEQTGTMETEYGVDGRQEFDPIDAPSLEEMTKLFKQFGLRNSESELIANLRRTPKIRVFLPRKEVKKKRMHHMKRAKLERDQMDVSGDAKEEELSADVTETKKDEKKVKVFEMYDEEAQLNAQYGELEASFGDDEEEEEADEKEKEDELDESTGSVGDVDGALGDLSLAPKKGQKRGADEPSTSGIPPVGTRTLPKRKRAEPAVIYHAEAIKSRAGKRK